MYRLVTTLRLPRAGYPLLVVGAALLALLLVVLLAPGRPGPGERHADSDRAVATCNGVSNFGPQNATGVAELITSEGEVRLTAAGLQKLADNEEYTALDQLRCDQGEPAATPGDGRWTAVSPGWTPCCGSRSRRSPGI